MKNAKLLIIVLFIPVFAFSQVGPYFEWAHSFSGSGTQANSGSHIILDNSNCIVSSGYFKGTVDFDPTIGQFLMTDGGGPNSVYLNKLSNNGNFIWAKKLDGEIVIGDISVDLSNNIIVTGSFGNTVDFDPDSGIFSLTASPNNDIFIAKYDSMGSFIWAKHLNGGGAPCLAAAVVIDNFNNIFITGEFEGTVDFDPDSNYFNLTSVLTTQSEVDVFIACYDSNGSFFWANRIGSGNYDAATDIDINNNNELVVIGNFTDTVDFDPGIGQFILGVSPGFSDMFVLKLNLNGDFISAIDISGNSFVTAYAIDIDINNNILITGAFRGTADFDPGPGIFNLYNQLTYKDDIFILKLNSNLTLSWAVGFGSMDTDLGLLIATDSLGNVITAGTFMGTVDFDPGAGIVNSVVSSSSDKDIFISILDPNGNYQFSGSVGNPICCQDILGGLHVNAAGDLYCNGGFRGAVDFDLGVNTFFLTSVGGTWTYIFKLNHLNTPPLVNFIGNPVSGNSPLLINFTDQSTNNPTMWNWSFPGGNPQSSTSQNPTVQYDTVGTFDVTLIVSNSFGSDTLTKSNYVIVNNIQVANSYLNISNYNINSVFQKTLWQDSTNITPIALKICADGSNATKFDLENNWAVANNNIRLLLKSDPDSTDVDKYGVFRNYQISGNNVSSWLTHPQYVQLFNGLHRKDTIMIVDQNNPGTSLYEIPIEVYRAPILFVHGFYGDLTTFSSTSDSLSIYYPKALRRNYDYKFDSFTKPLGKNAIRMAQEKDNLLLVARMNNYSTAKINVVAHSMGGLVSRVYGEGIYGFTNSDIQKIITINTPHSGSYIADKLHNFFYLPLFNLGCNNQYIYNNSPFCQNPGIQMRTNSIEIDNLLNAPGYLNNFQVPSHSITTESSFFTSLSQLDISDALVSFIHSFSVPSLIGADPNDGVVALESQAGGLTSSESSNVFPQFHIGSVSNSQVYNYVKLLLGTNPNSPSFSQTGFNPPDLRPVINPSPILSTNSSNFNLTENSTIVNISSPINGSIWNAGQTISLTVDFDTTVSNLFFLVNNSFSGLIAFDTISANSPLNINYVLPINASGPTMIQVLALGQSTILSSDSVFINVMSSITLDSIEIDPNPILCYVSSPTIFNIIGYFSDSIPRIITNESGLNIGFSVPGIAQITSSGIIEGISTDTITMTVSYQGFSDSISVVVAGGVGYSTPLFSSSNNIICGDSGSVSFVDLTTGHPDSILWSFNGGSPSFSVDTLPVISYSSPGLYEVSLIAYYSWGSDTLLLPGYINVVSNPLPPIVSIIGDSLFCNYIDTTYTYAWYNNGMLMAFGNQPHYLIDSSNWGGTFSLMLIDDFGCNSVSTNSVTSLVENQLISNVKVYPNPGTGIFNVELPPSKQVSIIEVYNVYGALLKSLVVNPAEEKTIHVVDIDNKSGVYFLKIALENQTGYIKLVKL